MRNCILWKHLSQLARCFFSRQPFCFHVQQKSFLCRLHFVTQNIKYRVKGKDLMKLIIFYLTNVSIHWYWLFFCIWWRINAVTVHTVDCHSLQFYPSLLLQVQGKRQHLEKDKWWLSEHDRTGVPWKDLRDSQNSWIHIENCCPREIIANINWVT